MKDKIFKFAHKNKESKIKRGYDYWNALFIGTFTASILIGFEVFKDILNKNNFIIDVLAFVVFVSLWLFSWDKTLKYYLALEIKGKPKKEAYKIMEQVGLKY